MPTALILSSHVAASRVGGSAQSLALTLFGVDTIVVPTVTFGRHPGWGPPGGAAVADPVFKGMLGGVEANGLFGAIDLVITGYFASVEQVRAAARAIDAVRAAAPRVTVVIDPTIGDSGKGLFVPAATAGAIQDQLLPRADLLRLNAWELGHLAGCEVSDPAGAVAAAQAFGRPVMASSIPLGETIGVAYAVGGEAWLASHPRIAAAPNGTGDLLTALLALARLEGLPPASALARAVGGVYETVRLAQNQGAAELPLAAMGQRLKDISADVRIERL